MTREEAKEYLTNISYQLGTIGIEYLSKKDGIKMREAIKILEQEYCEDEYIKVPKNALKYRTAGMVAYNAEWLKNHFDIERAVIFEEQKPCDCNVDGVIFNYLGERYICKNPVLKTIDGKGICSFYGFKRG